MAIPKVFLSYSHDSQEHKKWMLELATRLRSNGIDAIIDQFDLKPGDDVPHFMETNLESSDKILMVCTERYVEKANKGKGGVGYEKMIITSTLLKNIDENKIIPIIRQGYSVDLPTFIKTKLYINFSNSDDFETSFDDLVRTIHDSPLFEKPPIGNNPFQPVKKEQLDGDNDFVNLVLKTLIETQDNGSYANIDDVADKLKISYALSKVGLIKLIRLHYAVWYMPEKSASVTNEGLMMAYENKLLK